MSVNQVASRYAKSLLDLAGSINKSDTILRDMRYILQLTKNREIYLLLKSPIIYPTRKFSALKKILGESIDPVTLRFVELTINKGRESILPEISAEFETQYNKAHNILVVQVSSAVELDDATLKTITDKVTSFVGAGMKIEVKTKVDPTLVGGFVIEYGDMLFDSSVTSQLTKLKNSFSKN